MCNNMLLIKNNHLIWIFLCVFYFSIVRSDCSTEKKALKEAQKNFIFCANESYEPKFNVSFCSRCGNEYFQLITSFNNLRSTAMCREFYFDKDQLNLLEKSYQNLVVLWTDADCPACYNNATLLEEVYKFSNIYHYKFQNCLKENNICQQCSTFYEQLSNNYNHLQSLRNGKSCFDMQDIMNKTHHIWIEKGCIKETNGINGPLIGVSVTIAAIVILFYSGFIVYRSRRNVSYESLTEPDLNPASETVQNTECIASSSGNCESINEKTLTEKRRKCTDFDECNSSASDEAILK